MLPNIGSTEIIIVAVVLLVIFGPKKMPEFARSLAQSIKEVKKGFESNKDKKTAKKNTKAS